MEDRLHFTNPGTGNTIRLSQFTRCRKVSEVDDQPYLTILNGRFNVSFSNGKYLDHLL